MLLRKIWSFFSNCEKNTPQIKYLLRWRRSKKHVTRKCHKNCQEYKKYEKKDTPPPSSNNRAFWFHSQPNIGTLTKMFFKKIILSYIAIKLTEAFFGGFVVYTNMKLAFWNIMNPEGIFYCWIKEGVRFLKISMLLLIMKNVWILDGINLLRWRFITNPKKCELNDRIVSVKSWEKHKDFCYIEITQKLKTLAEPIIHKMSVKILIYVNCEFLNQKQFKILPKFLK